MTPGFRKTRERGHAASTGVKRCPCCTASWSTCPCTSVMCPRGGKECIDHCRCWHCIELRRGGVAAGRAAKGAI